LAEDLCTPLGVIDTALSVPQEKLDRLPAAYRSDDGGVVETEPAGGGSYARLPPFDLSHAASSSPPCANFHRLTRLLVRGGQVNGTALLGASICGR
jgi:hypothetical protein